MILVDTSVWVAYFNGQSSAQTDALDDSLGGQEIIVGDLILTEILHLTFRILKLLLVDQIPPDGILATTFTKKAAEELRSRILGWGFCILDVLDQDPLLSPEQKASVAAIDINQVWTGTVDSLCKQILRQFRAPGTQPPILVDDFVAKTLLLREGLFTNRRDQDPQLDAFLFALHSANNNRYGYHIGAKNNLLQSIWDRRFQDQVDWQGFLNGEPVAEQAARTLAGEVLADYEQALQQKGMVDFALLENEVRISRQELGDYRFV